MVDYLFNLGIILIFYISLKALYTEGQKHIFLSVPFFLAVLRWSRQTCPKNKSHPLSLVSGHFLSGATCLSVQAHSVCLSINTVCMYECVYVLFMSSCFTLFSVCISPQ